MYKLCNDILATLELDGIRINKEYTFPPKQELTVRLKDILEKDVDEKYYLSDERVAGLMASTEKERAKGNGFKFEPIEKEKIAHAISTKAGGRKTDNYITEPTIVAQRGRSNGDWHESEHFQQFEPRNDGLTNTLSSVAKDNYVAEPTPLQRKVCNEAIARGLVEPNDAIEYTYSNARLKEIGGVH